MIGYIEIGFNTTNIPEIKRIKLIIRDNAAIPLFSIFIREIIEEIVEIIVIGNINQ